MFLEVQFLCICANSTQKTLLSFEHIAQFNLHGIKQSSWDVLQYENYCQPILAKHVRETQDGFMQCVAFDTLLIESQKRSCIMSVQCKFDSKFVVKKFSGAFGMEPEKEF